MKLNKLTREEEYVMVQGGTEAPYSGKYDSFFEKGTYVCRRCGAPLYKSVNKFDAHCGWPAFDKEVPGAIKHGTDEGPVFGLEIRCANCDAHLGHVYSGERFTNTNTRHCVNSVALKFIPDKKGESGDEK